jgi:hypothetical protein
VETYLPIRDLENRVTQVAAFVVELTGARNLQISLNRLIGDLLHVSAGLKTELQFFATTGHTSNKTGGLLPQAVELIDEGIQYARNITNGSHRVLFADAPRLQVDGDRANGIAAGQAASTSMLVVEWTYCFRSSPNFPEKAGRSR